MSKNGLLPNLEVKDRSDSDEKVTGPSNSSGPSNLSLSEKIQSAILHTFESLENRDFRLLWFGMVFSMWGIQMQMVARGILVYDLTGDYTITGFVGMGFAPSLLVVSLFGGVLGDRMERRSIIQIAQLVNGLLAGVVGILIFFGVVVWQHLFVVSMIQGAMFAFMMPARQAAIPSLVKKHQLANAFALNAMAMSIMSLVAPAIAGYVYQFIGAEVVYFFICAVMVSAVVFTSMVPKMYPSDKSIKDSVVRNMLARFRYIGRNKVLLQLMIYSIVVALLAMPFRMLVPAYAKDVYGSAGSSVGILLTATGLGALIGSIAIANLREGHHRGWVLIGGALIAGLSLALISGFPVFLAGVIAMVGTGIGEQARWALGQSVMMENSADEYRSRVMSVLMMTYGLMPLGMYPLGWSMEKFGGQQAVGMIAVLLIAFGVLAVFLLPNLRRIK